MDVMKVVVAGAGALGRMVARYVKDAHDVTVIEKDEAIADALRAELDITVLLGDADEPAMQLLAGVDRSDVFVAATGRDEDNLVACLLAKNEYKVKKVVAAVRSPQNRWLFNRSWGVDVALDSGQIVARIIEEEATLTDVVRLLDLREGQVTITSITATAGGSLAGKTFAELRLPEGCHPAALLRGNDVVMPSDGVRIEVDDALLVIAGPGGACRVAEIG